MIISTQTCCMSRAFGDFEAIKKLADVGFDALDYSLFDLVNPEHPLHGNHFEKYALELKQSAAEYGIFFNQTHAPFPSYQFDKEEYNKKIFPLLVRSIAVTSVIGAEHVVIHPIAHKDKSLQKNFNLELYNKLLPYCKEYHVKIALENMWGHGENNTIVPNVCSLPEEFADYVDSLDPNYFLACLDLGHAGLVGETAEHMIRVLGHNRLKALHIHDNDHLSDMHTLPFLQKMNWVEIAKALKEIDYSGELTFEADNFYSKFPCEMYDLLSKVMFETGKHLVNMIENS